jgi:hypothetical protein
MGRRNKGKKRGGGGRNNAAAKATARRASRPAAPKRSAPSPARSAPKPARSSSPSRSSSRSSSPSRSSARTKAATRVAAKSTKKYSQLSDKQKAKVGSRSNYKQARATLAAKATPKRNTPTVQPRGSVTPKKSFIKKHGDTKYSNLTDKQKEKAGSRQQFAAAKAAAGYKARPEAKGGRTIKGISNQDLKNTKWSALSKDQKRNLKDKGVTKGDYREGRQELLTDKTKQKPFPEITRGGGMMGDPYYYSRGNQDSSTSNFDSQISDMQSQYDTKFADMQSQFTDAQNNFNAIQQQLTDSNNALQEQLNAANADADYGYRFSNAAAGAMGGSNFRASDTVASAASLASTFRGGSQRSGDNYRINLGNKFSM